jgi:hypothetical protein
MDSLTGFAYAHELIEANSGHDVGTLVPYDPSPVVLATPADQRDERAREAVWPQVLAFLARNG